MQNHSCIVWAIFSLLFCGTFGFHEDNGAQVFGDVTSNKLTREHDGSCGLWSYYGIIMQRVGPVVSTAWLSKVIYPGSKTLRVLDAVHGEASKETYKETHIPGALPFEISECSDKSSGYSSTLPSPSFFSDYVGRLGIDKDTHVVIYDSNEKVGAFTSPRVWWMFRIFGHPKVSVLNGGLKQWMEDGHPVSDVRSEVEPMKFESRFQPQLLKMYEDMVSNVKSKRFQVMDARSPGRFMGEDPEPREMPHLGHIPNSINIPFKSMFQEGTRILKEPEELKKLFMDQGVDFNEPLAATCGSGITACIITLGAHLAGHEDIAVFDGSWEEYGQRASVDLVAPHKDGALGG